MPTLAVCTVTHGCEKSVSGKARLGKSGSGQFVLLEEFKVLQLLIAWHTMSRTSPDQTHPLGHALCSLTRPFAVLGASLWLSLMQGEGSGGTTG